MVDNAIDRGRWGRKGKTGVDKGRQRRLELERHQVKKGQHG